MRRWLWSWKSSVRITWVSWIYLLTFYPLTILFQTLQQLNKDNSLGSGCDFWKWLQKWKLDEVLEEDSLESKGFLEMFSLLGFLSSSVHLCMMKCILDPLAWCFSAWILQLIDNVQWLAWTQNCAWPYGWPQNQSICTWAIIHTQEPVIWDATWLFLDANKENPCKNIMAKLNCTVPYIPCHSKSSNGWLVCIL